MDTVAKSTSVPKDDAEMKIFSAIIGLKGNAIRCESMLHYTSDPMARQGLMTIKQELLDNRDKLKEAYEEVKKMRLSAQS